MGNFFRLVFASLIGSLLSFVFAILLFFIIVIGLVSGLKDPKVATVKANSVLHLDLSYEIKERTSKDIFANFDFSSMEADNNLGLNDIIKNIRKAAEDDNIKGIYLELGLMPNGLATIEAIRNELLKFKESGKFVIAYGEVVTQKAYYLASVANEVYINPVGYLELKGFSAQLTFFKNMLDRLEIKTQVFYAGQFKSATEPFRYDHMSEPNRKQLTEYLTDVYGHFISEIAASRNLDYKGLDSIVFNLAIRQPEDAVKYKLVDELVYFDQIQDKLAEKTGKDSAKDLEFVSLGTYDNSPGKKTDFEKDKIAVLYAEGNIVDGDGAEDNIGSARFRRALQEIREDDKIKALVIRVNSGGGSALASEIMLREINLVKAKGIPVIVSMGDVAASGGYYIACFADTIVAQPNTITGSIGVFGLLPDMGGFFNDKLGITFDTVKVGQYSDFGTITRSLTAEEFSILQVGVDTIYLKFKRRVAEGRGMTVDYVDSVGQGRIWTGVQALENGLVDVLGGMDVALDIAKTKAGLENYRVVDYPKQKDPLAKLFSEGGDEVETRFMKMQLGQYYPMWVKMQELKNVPTGVQMRMPFMMEVF
jgi:protease IV